MTDFSQLVPISSIPNLNDKLRSATEDTMVDVLGRPDEPLDTTCDHNDQASANVKALQETRKIDKAPHIRVTGITPALDSLASILSAVADAHPDLMPILGTAGMLCVRHRKPTSGQPSTLISNHSWGTAIDFALIGHQPPGDTGQNVPAFIALMVPFFNQAGWYSGIGFRDDMHFEVADQTIRQWAADGKLGAPPAQPPAAVAQQDPASTDLTGAGREINTSA